MPLPVSVVAAAAALACAAVVMAAWDFGGPVRFAAVLALVSCAPGIPLVALIRLPSVPITVALGISVSWASWLLLSLAQITSGRWLPVWCAVFVSVVSVFAAIGYAILGRPGSPLAAIRRLPGDIRRVPDRVRVFARISSRPRPARGRFDRGRFGGVLALVLSGGLMYWESRVIDLDATGAMGVVAVLSWRMPVALTLIAGAFAYALARRRPDGPLAFGALALLVCALYQLVSVADGSPVVGTGFVHVGFIEYLGSAHRLPPSVDARFSWSGFFDAAAVIVELAGLHDAGPLLLWAPAIITAFAALPLFIIARVITGSQRLAWVSMAIYVCGNWFQQDYFAPQAIAIVMHFSVVATLLWLLRGGTLPPLTGSWFQRLTVLPIRVPGLPDGVSRKQALALEFTLLFIGSATVVSHQLTPVFTIATLTMLGLAGCLRQRWLPVALGVVFTLWLSYGAPDYWTGHLHVLLSDLGKVGSSFRSGVSDRVTGDPLYQRMQLVRIAWSGAIAVLAALGLLLHRRSKYALAALVLLAAPFTLIVAQSYGGEIVLRCFFYALPIMAPLAALSLRRIFGWASALAGKASVPGHFSPRPVAAVLLVPALITAALLGITTRGLNTAFERNPADVADAARTLLYRIPDGATLVPPNGEGTLRMSRLTTVFRPQNGKCSVWTIECVDSFGADYIFLSTGQQAALELQWGMPRGSLWTFADELVRQQRYRVVDRTAHVIVLERNR